MRHKSFEDDLCPAARSLDSIGEWWSLLIVRNALFGMRRFSDFQEDLGLAKNILSVRLKKLIARGIMEQVPASDGSAYQEYVLTKKGRELFPVIVALRIASCTAGACATHEPRVMCSPLTSLDLEWRRHRHRQRQPARALKRITFSRNKSRSTGLIIAVDRALTASPPPSFSRLGMSGRPSSTKMARSQA